MFRMLLDNIDARERSELARMRELYKPKTEPVKEHIPTPEPVPEPQPQPVAEPQPPKPKRVRKPKKAVVTEQPPQVAPAPSPVVEANPVEAKAVPKKAKVNRDMILDRLSRMKSVKRDEILDTVETLSQEPDQIKEEIKKAKGRLKILKSAEELLKHESDHEDIQQNDETEKLA